MRKKNGFSLIELLAVVAVLAILALISIPMVQDYVDKAEVKARDVNARNLLRAADNYYSYVNMEMGTEFPIVLDLPSDELKLSGGQPESGQIIIYEDGSVFMDATFDGVTYVKDRTETKASTDKIIGSYEDWLVEPNEYPNTLLKYRPYDVIKNQMDNIFQLVEVAINYAYSDETTTSLSEDIEVYKNEYFNDYDKKNMAKLPKELTDEINYMINKFNITLGEDEDVLTLFDDPKLPYIYDLLSVIENEQIFIEAEMYDLLVSKNKELSKNTITIPNYVRREDGGLEKITIIGASTFRAYVDPIEDEDDSSDSAFEDVLEGLTNAILQIMTCSLVPTTDYEEFRNIIIPEGIEEIQEVSFGYCGIESVKLPKSLKTIGGMGFTGNQITKLDLPGNLESIGDQAFQLNGLTGELIIPKNVIEIGSESFAGNEVGTASDSEIEEQFKAFPEQIKIVMKKAYRTSQKLTKVTFQSGSKIEIIDSNAFKDNALTTVTIPRSIKEIGSDAFNCATLTSAHVERAQGTDLTIDATAFGSIIPTYGN